MFDIVSYILGKKVGRKNVILDLDDYTFYDDGSGNVEIKEIDNGE